MAGEKLRHHLNRTWIVTEHDYTLHHFKGSAEREAERLRKLHPEKTFRVVRLSRTMARDQRPNKLSECPPAPIASDAEAS